MKISEFTCNLDPDCLIPKPSGPSQLPDSLPGLLLLYVVGGTSERRLHFQGSGLSASWVPGY